MLPSSEKTWQHDMKSQDVPSRGNFFDEVVDRRRPWMDYTLKEYYSTLQRGACHVNEECFNEGA